MQKRSKPKAGVRIVVDSLLAINLVAVMATALVQEAPHEWLGLLLAVLMVGHAVMNRRWFVALGRGRWTALRVLQTAIIVLVALCLVGQVASAVVLSKHALWFLPAVPGTSWARSVHMVCSYWMFVLAFAHAGLQLKTMMVRVGLPKRLSNAARWTLRATWVVVAVFGLVSFAQLGLADYLLLRVQFAAADYGSSLALTFVRYACVAALICGVFHYLRVAIDRRSI